MNYRKTYLNGDESREFGRLVLSDYFSGAKKILDAGCGNGWFVRLAPERIIGIDPNPKKIRGAKIYKRSILKNGFRSGTFDGVFSSHMIEHFGDPDSVMREFNRIMRPGGRLVVLVPHKTRSFDPDHKSFFDKKSLKKMFENNGFSAKVQDFAGFKKTMFLGTRFAWKISGFIPRFGFRGALIGFGTKRNTGRQQNR